MDIYIGVKDTRQTVDYKLLFHLFAYMFAHSEPYPSPCIRGQAGQTYRRLQTPSSPLCVYVCPFRALLPPFVFSAGWVDLSRTINSFFTSLRWMTT